MYNNVNADTYDTSENIAKITVGKIVHTHTTWFVFNRPGPAYLYDVYPDQVVSLCRLQQQVSYRVSA